MGTYTYPKNPPSGTPKRESLDPYRLAKWDMVNHYREEIARLEKQEKAEYELLKGWRGWHD